VFFGEDKMKAVFETHQPTTQSTKRLPASKNFHENYLYVTNCSVDQKPERSTPAATLLLSISLRISFSFAAPI
jgi:hypothetical protein